MHKRRNVVFHQEKTADNEDLFEDENESSEIISKFAKKINKVSKDEDVRNIKIMKRKLNKFPKSWRK
jgi:hypothetical protein